MGAERFEAPEILFQPHLIDKETVGLSDSVFNVIQGAEFDVRPELYKHIVLSGGTTMFPGFPTRLEMDLQALHLKHTLQGDVSRRGKLKIRVEDPPNRKHAVFAGGAVLADIMRGNDAFWVSRAEWEANGPAALSKLQRSPA